MQDFINMAASQLGISTQQSSSATAGILGVLQKQMGGGDFSNLLGSLPGAGDILKQATGGAMGGGGASSGGGLGALGGMLGGVLGGNKSGGGNAMGGIMQAASGLLGGNKGGGGDILGLLGGVLGNSGMSMDKLGPFMGLFLNYVQGQAGQGGLNSILGALPDLKKFIG
jgi:hypothetical protein